MRRARVCRTDSDAFVDADDDEIERDTDDDDHLAKVQYVSWNLARIEQRMNTYDAGDAVYGIAACKLGAECDEYQHRIEQSGLNHDPDDVVEPRAAAPARARRHLVQRAVSVNAPDLPDNETCMVVRVSISSSKRQKYSLTCGQEVCDERDHEEGCKERRKQVGAQKCVLTQRGSDIDDDGGANGIGGPE